MFFRTRSRIVAGVLAVLLPAALVFAAADFDNSTLFFQIKNITAGDTNFADSTSADPGDTLNFFMRWKNGGVDTATESVATVDISDYTHTAHSTYWAWSSATNVANDNDGVVLFSPHYVDNNSNGSIDSGDLRVNYYGINSTSTDGKYTENSTVAGSDYDDGDDLTSSVVDYLYITGGDATYASGEDAYVKGDGNGTTTAVEIGDIRMTGTGGGIAGTLVVSGDSDICTGCLNQATNIYRLDDGNDSNNTLWPFDEGGFPLGDMGANRQIIIKSTEVTINSSVGSALTPGVSLSATNASTILKSGSITVDTTPSVGTVTFSPSSITNDGSSSTTLTAVVSDKNGISDINTVVVDLSGIGLGSVSLYDDGTNGDTTANDGTWTRGGITTTVTAATYTPLPVTATDSTSQTASADATLIVQAGGTPTVTIASTSPDTVGNSNTSTISWSADEPIYAYTLYLDSCSGTALTGSNVANGDGSAQVLGANSTVNSVLDNSNFVAGDNTIYVCATDADSNVGQAFTTVTKDTTTPTVTVAQVSPGVISTGQTSNVTWSANETGTYEVRVSSCSGTLVTGPQASGTYSTADTNIASTIEVTDLTEGDNTIYVCVTDDAGNEGSNTGTLTRDTTAPDRVTDVTLVDNDSTEDGVDGRDITISWTSTSTDSSFSFYKFFILPDGTALDTGIHGPIGSVSGQTTNTFTSTDARTTDSAGTDLTAGDYVAYVIAVDTSSQESSSASSSAATLVLDDTSAPSFVSAETVDVNTVLMTFSEDISEVDTNKISATGLTIDTSYNDSDYTSGYRIQSADSRNILLRVSTVATSYTASNLALAACAVRDVTGTSDLNESGNCSSTTAVTNANAAESGLSIADGVGPTLTLNSPEADGTDNATVSVEYTLSETAQENSLNLSFTATGGSSDANSPHTILLDDTLVGSDAEASGTHTFTLDASSFTSQENGASDTLVDGTIYTVALSGSDSSGNAGSTASSTSWTYDTSAPTAPVTTQSFSSPTANTIPTFAWSSVSDAVQYQVQVSLNSTNYSPTFASKTLSQVDISSASWSSGTATFTAINHGLNPNETTTVAGISPSGYNGSHTVVSIPDANTFTVGIDSDPGAYVSGGTTIGTSWILTPPFVDDGTADDTYIWRVYGTDAAGNTSDASNQQTFILNTQTDTPGIAIADQTNASQGVTNSDTVDVTIDGYTSDVTHYILSEAQSTQPFASDSAWVSIPGTAPQTVSFTFATTTEETKTVYVWVRDAQDNISENVSSDTIVLDTTAPGTPTLAVADANGGADSGKTNDATIDITVGNDTGVASWCVVSGTTGFSPTDPTESDCSTGQTGATVAGGWVSSEPTSHTLNTTGIWDVYVWTQDTAGNVSAASSAATIDYQTTVPPDPALALTDQTSGSGSVTDASTVNASITNDATANYWILSTSQSSKPAENSGDWSSSEPTSIDLGSTEGLRTVYVWVKNEYGSVSNNQVTDSITLDTSAPTFATRKTQDLDGDGQIDAMQITMNEDIVDSTIVRSDFSLGSSYTTSSFTGTLGAISFTSGISTGSTSDDSLFYIALTESGSTDSGTTPSLSYTAGSLADEAGNTVASAGSASTTDGASPVLADADPIRVADTDADGLADQIRVIYSETLGSTTATAPWSLANVPSSGTLSSVSLTTTTTTNDTVLLTLTEGSSAQDTSAGSLTVELDNSGSNVADSSSNAASNFSATAAADYMGPVLVSASYISTGTVANDNIIVTFSEDVSDSSVDVHGDFSVSGGGSIANATLNTGDADDNSVTIELNSGDSELTVGTSTLALSSTAVVADATSQANTNDSTTAVTVGGGLVINEIHWAGTSGDSADEWIELRNLSSSTINFSTDYHCLYVGSSKLVDLTGSIASSDYFVISRYDVGSSTLSTAPDLSAQSTPSAFEGGSWTSLPDTNLQLTLYSSTDSTCTDADTALDTADDGSGTPFAGESSTPASMERNESIGLGTSSNSWHTAVASTGFDNSTQLGTPGSANVADDTAPTIDTNTQFPTHQSLLPLSPPTISASYVDNSGGVGVDTSSVTMEIDLNGDGDYNDTNEGTSGFCSGSNLTATTTEARCNTSSTLLSSGKHSVRLTVADTAGNSTQSTWDFWVDDFTVSISNVDQADLGFLLPGTGVETTDNSQHTQITITTYGAGITLTGSQNQVLTSGASTISSHINNVSSASIGGAYRVKEGAAGSFGNYFNFVDQGQVATKSQLNSATLASTNALQTYTFFVQYYADADVLQAAGVYTQDISYTVRPSY